MITHDALVQIAAKFVKNNFRCSLVFTEPVTAGIEIPDVIGFRNGVAFVVECKTSKADFKRDDKKWFRRQEIYGIGMGDFRYFMIPESIVNDISIPPESRWGLIVVDKGQPKIKLNPFEMTSNKRAEIMILQSCLRRLGTKGIVSFRELRKKVE